jgi:tetratricopeptide (TPR) repeat protein
MKADKKTKTIGLTLLKGLVTLALILFFVWAGARKWDRYARVKSRSEFSQLGYLMPRDIQAFVRTIEGGRDFAPGQLESYIAYYEKMTDVLPGKADAHGLLGFCYAQAGFPDEAIMAYERAIAINPHFFWFHYNLGCVYYQQAQYEKAMASFKTAVEKSFEAAVMFIRLSKRIYHPLLVHRSQYTEGFLKQRFDRHTQKSYALIVKAAYHLKQYDDVISIAHYANTREDAPKQKELYYFYMGKAAFQKKAYRQAVFFLQNVIELNARNAGAFHWLGRAARQLGNAEAALKYTAMSRYLQEQDKDVPVQAVRPRLESF